MTVEVGPLRFHLSEGPGEFSRPTRAWAVDDPNGRGGIEDWKLTIDPPPAESPRVDLHDLKRWFLFFPQTKRYLTVGGTKKGLPIGRLLRSEVAMEKYLKEVIARLGPRTNAAKLSLLVPALEDDEVRKRYVAFVRQVLPDSARILPEPEMVLEYFRLVRRDLVLDSERNNHILVVDVGAATTNLTIVSTNKEGRIVGGTSGRRRAGRLSATQAALGNVAGQWVDAEIARRLGVNLEALPIELQLEYLRRIEQAKIEASLTGASAPVRFPDVQAPVTVSRELLQTLALDVVTSLEPLLLRSSRRLWEKITATEYASKQSAEERAEKGVVGPETALNLIDIVILAGGTTQLPGFREALLLLLPKADPRVLDVEGAFPVAAAVGALAHTLADDYEPPRIRAATIADVPSMKLEGALAVDVALGWREGEEKESRLVILERGDPIVYEAGAREKAGQLPIKQKSEIDARLIPDTRERADRIGLGYHPLVAKRDNPSFGVRVDGDRKLSLISDELRNIEAPWLDLNQLTKRQESADAVYAGEIPEGLVAFDESHEVVIDFGMSKTVVVSSGAGLLDPSAFDRVGLPPTESEAAEPAIVAMPAIDAPELATPSLSPAAIDAHPGPARPTAAPSEVPPEPASQDSNEPAPAPRVDDMGRPLGRRRTRVKGGSYAGFVATVESALSTASHLKLEVPRADLTMALLGLSVRPLLLLAGPPGCGKSTLARVVAQLLGKRSGRDFHEVSVQAHWNTDEPLFGREGVLTHVLAAAGSDEEHVILFDEINLTRPEYYLSRLFHALDGAGSGRLKLPHAYVIGTLNIDDTSRAPSPKVLDRAFLVEMDQAPHHQLAGSSAELDAILKLPSLPNLPFAQAADDTIQSEPELRELLDLLYSCVEGHGLRQDLLPSRRAVTDVRDVLALHRALGDSAEALIPRPDLLDRLFLSRFLVRLNGPSDQVDPALDALEKHFTVDARKQFVRVRRRIQLARRQTRLGFVSPWH
ncbi:AAA family ATPase [Myxococcota bacterium]|nr:AAA family ATPase [Myxococcota bacterium]